MSVTLFSRNASSGGQICGSIREAARQALLALTEGWDDPSRIVDDQGVTVWSSDDPRADLKLEALAEEST
ncbi:hypothetical protein [Panacagrimonas perspica]|uniref:hypothetical protein n=1 Tax=Panacagrimonas perspica TaxID=381431 RepID=UPI00105FEE4F|nr:hypothetical protein [Panacagrimonas perspica]